MQLSNSSLNIFKECPRCFYIDRIYKSARPRGIFSSLPNAIDGILKDKLEAYRGGLPPSLVKYPELNGFELYNGSDLKKMRNWKTNPLKMQDAKGNTIVGAFDDLLYNPKTAAFAILDYKTKGSKPDQAYCEKYYQQQVDIYSRFLEAGGKVLAPFAVLLYFWSEPSVSEIQIDSLVSFDCQPFFLKPDPAAAEELFKEAVDCLEGQLPGHEPACEYC